jgi:hypothetical protein
MVLPLLTFSVQTIFSRAGTIVDGPIIRVRI